MRLTADTDFTAVHSERRSVGEQMPARLGSSSVLPLGVGNIFHGNKLDGVYVRGTDDSDTSSDCSVDADMWAQERDQSASVPLPCGESSSEEQLGVRGAAATSDDFARHRVTTTEASESDDRLMGAGASKDAGAAAPSSLSSSSDCEMPDDLLDFLAEHVGDGAHIIFHQELLH